jgi:hypothetical protein
MARKRKARLVRAFRRPVPKQIQAVAGPASRVAGHSHKLSFSRFASLTSLRPFISLYHWRVQSKRGRIRRVRYWEIIADNLSKAGWSWGCVATVDSNGMRLAIKIVTSGRDQNTDLMNFIFTKNIGMLLLAIYLIVIGLSTISALAISGVITGVLALAAGIFILIGR